MVQKKKKQPALPLSSLKSVIASERKSLELQRPESPEEPEQLDISALSTVLSAEFPLLDQPLIIALLSDYDPDTLTTELPGIRDQLGILEASLVPDLDDFTTSDVDVELTDELANSVSSMVLDGQNAQNMPNAGSASTSSKKSKSKYKSKSKGRGKVNGIGNGKGTGSSALSRTTSRSDSGSGLLEVNSANTRTSATSGTSGDGYDDSGSGSGSGGLEGQGIEGELELLQNLFPNLSKSQLKSALSSEPSLPAAIDHLLSIELIKDVETRGSWPEDPHIDEETVAEWSGLEKEREASLADSDWSPFPSGSSSSSLRLRPSPLARSSSSVSHPPPSARKSRSKRHHQITVPLVDTLQRSSPLPSPGPSRTQSPNPSGGKAKAINVSRPDNAWGTMASLAAHLSDLLPHPTSYFISYLHSPRYYSPYSAVRASLVDLPSSPKVEADLNSRQVLEEMYGVMLGDATLQTQADLELCTQVVGGDVATVMDLMDLLVEVGTWGGDDDLGRYDQYSQPTVARSPRIPSSPVPLSRATLSEDEDHHQSDNDTGPDSGKRRSAKDRFTARPNNPKPVVMSNGTAEPFRTELMMRPGSTARTTVVIPDRVIPGSKASTTSTTNPTATDNFGATSSFAVAMGRSKSHPGKQVHPLNWRHVTPAERQRRMGELHPYASHIPSYAKGITPHDTTPGALYTSTADGDLTIEECLRRAQAEREKRESSVRLAGRHYKSTSSQATRGSIAGSYAIRARESADLARQWEMKAARMVVMSRLEQTGHTIDLHNLTIMEAKQVVLEAAERWWEKERSKFFFGISGDGSSMQKGKTFVPGKSLTVITGVGRHSAGKMGVLGPAVANALEEHGWKVDRGERTRGYVTVHGKRI